jgi:uncharacterized protein YkwD
VLVALVLLPAAASAATRLAAPGGALNLGCLSPCPLDAAVNTALPGDEVIVAPGDYDLGGAALNVPAAVNLHGADGQPRPTIHGASGGLTPLVNLAGAGATLRHLSIRQDGAGGQGGHSNTVNAAVGGSLLDLLLTNTAAGGTPARLGAGSTMSGSTALARAASGIGVLSAGTPVTLHNVTAWAAGGGGAGLDASGGPTVATNTIARAPAGTDVAGGGATMVSSNSGGAPAPLLADPNAGDFHQLAGSPTIDAGLVDALAGLTDIDGEPRILGATQDIGADEYVSHRPMASTGAANGATVNGSVTPNGIPTSFHFDYGTTPLYGKSTPASDAGSAAGPTPVSATLGGLTPGSIVHYRVVAQNADGQTAGLDRVLIAPGALTGAQVNAPHFSSITAPATATVGQAVRITAAGSDRNDPINSIAVDFDDGPGFFAESACRLRPRNRAFRNRRRARFSVPYTFSNPGVHTVKVTLGSGNCRRRGQRTSQTVQVNVLPRTKLLARVRAREDEAIASARCANANLLPAKGNTARIEKSTLCLLNAVRRQHRLRRFHRNRKLRKAARFHTSFMIRRKFFAHQCPGEPSLATRFRRVRYRGGGGENIGIGSGTPYATPRSMLEAWMGSPVHRANILERRFHTIGIAVVPQKPLAPQTPGATYTTEFGTTRR